MTQLGDKLFGKSPAFCRLLQASSMVAATDATVLLLGESGTGKELLAREIHDNSLRASAPFVAINCAGIPEGLFESELFGHRKGSFTGAVQDGLGHVQRAAGGTLFLDEVGELTRPAQAKLLRFLETRECQTIGQCRPGFVDVRVIAATNRDLSSAVDAGEFREDLYFRLNVVPLEMPALRDRAEDIAPLLKKFLSEFTRQHGLDKPEFSAAAHKRLTLYDWPGNVRELRNLCERLVILFPGKAVNVENLPREVRQGRTKSSAGEGFLLPDAGLNLQQLELDMIRQALGRTGGNKSRAARLLGLTRDTFLYRMQKYLIKA